MHRDKQYGKAVILGAAGFIGINLANHLAKLGFNLVCFDRYLSPHWPQTATAIIGDFDSQPSKLLQELDNAFVFHLISSTRPSPSTGQIADEIRNDVVTTISYLEKTKTRDLRWIFLSSGGTVYGQSNKAIIKETNATIPICSYGVVKLSIEHYFSLYRVLHNVDCIIVRPGNPYGPWQHPQVGQGIISAILYKALLGKVIEIWGDGENIRDYIYIEDTILGIMAAAIGGRTGEIYNIGTSIGLSINQLVKVISETLNLKLMVNYSSTRSIDVKRNVLSAKKLSTHTGWESKTSIHNGVVLTASWINTILE
jgi:UDP-glucose 4-epimerase